MSETIHLHGVWPDSWVGGWSIQIIIPTGLPTGMSWGLVWQNKQFVHKILSFQTERLLEKPRQTMSKLMTLFPVDGSKPKQESGQLMIFQ